MAKTHVFLISMLLGLATAAGAVALVRSVQLGQAASAQASSKAATTSNWIAKRNRALDQAEIALRKALRKVPPKLPKIPHFKAVSAPPPAPSVGYASAPAAAPAVRYVRPAPIVVVKHRHHGDDRGGDDGGGGDD